MILEKSLESNLFSLELHLFCVRLGALRRGCGVQQGGLMSA